MRMADEIDAGQERGEIATGRPDKVPGQAALHDIVARHFVCISIYLLKRLTIFFRGRYFLGLLKFALHCGDQKPPPKYRKKYALF